MHIKFLSEYLKGRGETIFGKSIHRPIWENKREINLQEIVCMKIVFTCITTVFSVTGCDEND
jgi:hypothetical protein